MSFCYMNFTVPHGHLPVGDKIDRPGQNLPLRFLHHAALKDLRSIPFLYLHRFLENDRSRIGSRVTKCTVAPVTFTPLANTPSWT